MKAIGRNLIIKIIKEATTKTKGGLILNEKSREDIRYRKATIVSVGTDVEGVTKNDTIYFDRNAGHGIEIDNEKLHVIKNQDVVVVL
jgi:co-chaperonin GroES (HSP10)|tara:strand:- start:24359 stop:24619 length:261 start_codon:yes stop_codon:yes gene_type:complete